MKFYKQKIGRGFSLVELLAVVAIIGLLSAVVMSSFSSAKKRSRVAKRVSDMKQVQVALEFYYAANRSFPNTGGAWRSACTAWGGYTGYTIIPELIPAYIPVVPTDPQTSSSSSDQNCYVYASDGTNYIFMDYQVPEMYSGQSAPNYMSYPELVDPGRDSGTNNSTVDGIGPWSWKIYSSGSAAW